MNNGLHISIDERSYSQYWAIVKERLASGNPVILSLGGKSMWPTLSIKDKITITPGQEPQVGDVVLFDNHGLQTVHRLVAIDGDRLTARGDNNYGCETFDRKMLLGVVTMVVRADGKKISTDSAAWRRISRRSLVRQRIKNGLNRWLGSTGRKKLRPWYFVLLAILMWAPLNGVGLPLNNYVLGLRMDHLLHASVFIPCAVFLMDFWRRENRRKPWVWLCAVGVGMLTESVQYLLPYRGFDINDMVANFLGVSLGWLVILLAWHRRNVKA